jgi:hypothetical protein
MDPFRQLDVGDAAIRLELVQDSTINTINTIKR